jgi:hypothetical protein
MYQTVDLEADHILKNGRKVVINRDRPMIVEGKIYYFIFFFFFNSFHFLCRKERGSDKNRSRSSSPVDD